MIGFYYTDGSFSLDGDPEEIVKYLSLMREEQEKAETQKITLDILEMIHQINKEKKKKRKKKDG